MPKQKTHKGIAKRIKITGRGKVKRWRGGKSHLLSGKNSRRKRRLSRPVVGLNAEDKKLRRQLHI